MIHRCDKCPGSKSLRKFLDEILVEYDIEMEISFKQWQTTDRSTLVTQTSTIDEYKDILIMCIEQHIHI